MKGMSLSLSAQGVYYKVLVAFSLMTLLPILITIYLGSHAIFPWIPEAERLGFADPVVQVLIWTVVVLPLLGLSIVVQMAKRIEKLAKAIRVLEETPQEMPESKGVTDTQDEIEVLAKHFFEMRDVMSKQMAQLDGLKTRLDESNMRVLVANKELKELSIRDGLTALFNRRYFDERFEEEIQRAQRYGRKVAVEMIDIDHFKQLNDTYGHSCGDEVLQQIAQVMKENTRGTDIVCRYGGEEFCILLLEMDEESAYDHAERLRKAVSLHIFRNGRDPLNEKITISIGVAFFPQDAKDGRMVIESADSALYAAKRAGRNQVKRSSELQKQT